MSNNLPATPAKTPFLSDAQYDRLKFLTQIVLPALGALYFGLAAIWGLPEAEKVVGTIVCLDTFLGVVLGLSSKQYNQSDAKYDGTLEVVAHDTSLIHQLEIKTPPEEIGSKDSILIKVQPRHFEQ
jgi:hypothetical protein